jgi:acyl-CoA synthetase (AMP-forming)/AMP-acid ligase II
VRTGGDWTPLIATGRTTSVWCVVVHDVALLFDNRAAMLELAWAAQRSGLYFTPVNPKLSADEAAYIVDDCGATVLFAATSVAARSLPVPALGRLRSRAAAQ